MDNDILELKIGDFGCCGELWDLEKHRDIAEQFQRELATGVRRTFVMVSDGKLAAEVSLVTDNGDREYTIPGARGYLSHLIVRRELRRRGIGLSMVEYACQKGRELGLSELTVGVDADNFPALSLYVRAGFDKILYTGRDGQGAYLKLLKRL